MIKIHVLDTGKVHVPTLVPFGSTGFFNKVKKIVSTKDWVWLPVTSYLIEHPKGLVLLDTGWDRRISPNGEYDKDSQYPALGSRILSTINEGVLPSGKAIDEHLLSLGYKPHDLDYVLISHLDCDHVCGVKQVAAAKQIMVSEDEMKFATNGSIMNSVRYQPQWWSDVNITLFNWNDNQGPFNKSYDLFGDRSLQLISIPGHSAGLFSVKITNSEGKYVLLDSDGAYSSKSWKEMILPGIGENTTDQLKSLHWIRDQSLNENCIASLATHDPDILPQVIIF